VTLGGKPSRGSSNNSSETRGEGRKSAREVCVQERVVSFLDKKEMVCPEGVEGAEKTALLEFKRHWVADLVPGSEGGKRSASAGVWEGEDTPHGNQ